MPAVDLFYHECGHTYNGSIGNDDNWTVPTHPIRVYEGDMCPGCKQTPNAEYSGEELLERRAQFFRRYAVGIIAIQQELMCRAMTSIVTGWFHDEWLGLEKMIWDAEKEYFSEVAENMPRAGIPLEVSEAAQNAAKERFSAKKSRYALLEGLAMCGTWSAIRNAYKDKLLGGPGGYVSMSDLAQPVDLYTLEPGDKCLICHVPYGTPNWKGVPEQAVRLPCHSNHILGPDCLLQWMAMNPTCPVCRTEFQVEPTQIMKLKLLNLAENFSLPSGVIDDLVTPSIWELGNDREDYFDGCLAQYEAVLPLIKDALPKWVRNLDTMTFDFRVESDE